MREVLPGAIFSVALSLALWGVIWLNVPTIVHENEIIEYLQVAFLFTGSVIFLYSFYKVMPNSYGILYLSLGIFYLTFLIRELEPTETQTVFAIIVNPPVRNYWLISCWAVALFLFLRKPKSVFMAFREWIRFKQGAYILFGGIFYLLADLFDKQIFNIGRENNLFVEECLEFNGTLFMVLSAFFSLAWSQPKEWWSRANIAID